MRLIFTVFILLYIFNINTAQKAFEGSKIKTVPIAATISRVEHIKSDWNINLKSFAASPNKSSISDDELENLKNSNDLRYEETASRRNATLDAVLNINFEGNRGNGSVPPDNTIAVSPNGFIITSINSNLVFTSSEGKNLKEISLGDFFSDLRLSGGYFDPKVLFDHEEKKFILVALSGSTAATSHVVIGFSETENPLGKWNLYAIKGDVNGDNVWFDYPNIGVNNEDLFITGNMFTDAPGFKYSTVLQIDKDNGYNGSPINFKHYTNMKEKLSGQTLFNLTPCPKGWDYNLNENMYFLTNDNRGGQVMLLCEITKKLEDNPTLNIGDVVQVPRYNVAPNAPQKNSSDKLKTGDCRVMYGMEINGIIHYVLNSGANNLAGLTYGRYNLNTNQIKTSFYSEPGMYLGYPSIAAFGKTEDESKVLINYLRSNDTTFAEMAAVVCDGIDNDFVWSNPTLIKTGLSFVSALDGEFERWGDYSALFRRFWNGKTEVWASGCIGRAFFGSWTAQLMDQEESGARQSFYDFSVDKSVINPGDTIVLTYFGDIVDVTSLQWSFPGATFISQDSNSITLSYDALGFYDINLVGTDVNSADTFHLYKENYISVLQEVFKPLADFTADKTVAYVGDTIQLQDLTSNVPDFWKWTFIGGSPASSNLQHPKVVYSKKGQYNIVLAAKNDAGESVKVKQKFITITERPVTPIADFSADKTEILEGDTVVFNNIVLNNPTSFQWLLPGADVNTASVSSPVAKYSLKGSYDVTLIASNEAGSDTISKLNYINVGAAAIEEVSWINTNILYPNPVINETFSLEFNLFKTAELVIRLNDAKGNLVKLMIEKTAKAGKNQFSFNANMLSNGYYILSIEDKKNKKFKNIPFVINR